MKIKFVTMALLLSLMAVGCQKETMYNESNAPEQISSIRKIIYFIDGVEYRTTLRGNFEWQQFVAQMLSLAREGHSVSFFNENTSFSNSDEKDVVTYNTENEDDANRWAAEMSDLGYTVRIEYDKVTHIYTCTAIK